MRVGAYNRNFVFGLQVKNRHYNRVGMQEAEKWGWGWGVVA